MDKITPPPRVYLYVYITIYMHTYIHISIIHAIRKIYFTVYCPSQSYGV